MDKTKPISCNLMSITIVQRVFCPILTECLTYFVICCVGKGADAPEFFAPFGPNVSHFLLGGSAIGGRGKYGFVKNRVWDDQSYS